MTISPPFVARRPAIFAGKGSLFYFPARAPPWRKSVTLGVHPVLHAPVNELALKTLHAL